MRTYQNKFSTKRYIVLSAIAVTSGYGHKKITVELMEEFSGDSNKFSVTINNMPAFDSASDLDGDEKNEALFEIIKNSIEEEVYEWLEA